MCGVLSVKCVWCVECEECVECEVCVLQDADRFLLYHHGVWCC